MAKTDPRIFNAGSAENAVTFRDLRDLSVSNPNRRCAAHAAGLRNSSLVM